MSKEKMFENLDKYISFQEEKVRLLKEHKKGLIQYFKSKENESKNN